MERLRELREARGLLQKDVAEYIGVDRSTYVKYERGQSEPSYTILSALARFFHVSIDYLLGNDIQPRPQGVRIPVIGASAAGLPITTVQEYIDEDDPDTWEEISVREAATGDFVAVRITGDSMEPRILDGDVVIVRVQPDVDNGDTAIVIVNGDEATCKKIKKSPEGLILIANNPKYEPMFYSNKDVRNLPVRIYGKVVEVRSRL